MASRIPGLSWLAVSRVVFIVFTVNSVPAVAAPSPGAVRISIENEYEGDVNFGVLGKVTRNGKDRAEGVLSPVGTNYVGTVDAVVVSTQQISGLTGDCGPGVYDDRQKLQVTGRPTPGFNDHVQSISVTSGQLGNEYLLLEFVPKTPTIGQQASPPGVDKVVACHTLIESEATLSSGFAFLPLNDSRWTTPPGGYIIALPNSGILEYTDTTVLTSAGSMGLGPFHAKKSIWKIRVERLSASGIPPAPPTPATPTLPVGCVEPDPNSPTHPAPSQTSGGKPVCPPPPPRAPQSPPQD